MADIRILLYLPVNIPVPIIIGNGPSCDFAGLRFALDTCIRLFQRFCIYLFVLINTNDEIHFLSVEYSCKDVAFTISFAKSYILCIIL